MSLLYYPAPGEILICHYGREHDVIAPEMWKSRPVVVVGPRLRRRGRLVTVVPLSTTAPKPVAEDYHCKFELAVALPPPFSEPVMWAKCDMVSAVSLDRLDRFKEPKSRYGGPRKWTSGKLSGDQFKEIQRATLCGLGFGILTKHV